MNKESVFEQLKIDEGVKYEVYLDHLGLPTFGVGHLVTEDDRRLVVLSEEEHELHPLDRPRALEAEAAADRIDRHLRQLELTRAT